LKTNKIGDDIFWGVQLKKGEKGTPIRSVSLLPSGGEKRRLLERRWGGVKNLVAKEEGGKRE